MPGFGFECRGCDAFTETDAEAEDAPHIKLMHVDIVDGERTVREKQKRYFCDDCRANAFADALAATDTDTDT